MARLGKFITFEGIDGAGKTTQIRLLDDWLRRKGVNAICTREPGGTPLAETLREIIKAGNQSAKVELALLLSARADHIQRVISPALSQGKWVLVDRFLDSTFAYQGYGLGVDLQVLRDLHGLLCDDLVPDTTIVLDVDEHIQQQRKTQPDDGIEARDDAFQKRVRQGFLTLAQQNPETHLLLSADQDKEKIHALIQKHIHQKFWSA